MTMTDGRQDTTALITGASAGIGYEMAKILAEKKCDLVLVARRGDKLEAIARELTQAHGVKVKVIAKDLCSIDAIDELHREVTTAGIHVDYLINNAGFGDFGYFLEADWENLHRMVQLNVLTPTYLIKLFGKQMVTKGSGRILNVASTGSFFPGHKMAVYFATKTYVRSFTEAVASELEGTGVTVTTLCPGPTLTDTPVMIKWEGTLLSKLKANTSQEVARYGVDAMLSGRRLAIPGLLNKLTTLAPRFIPRSLLTKLMKLGAEISF